MKSTLQTMKCWFGYHVKERTFLKRTDQRILLTVCAHCDRVTRFVRMSKEQAKSVRTIGRKFSPFELHDGK